MAFIEFTNISKVYQTGETSIKALDEASFFVEKGGRRQLHSQIVQQRCVSPD